MYPVAFVTCTTQPFLTADDTLAAAAVETNLNAKVIACPWDDPGIVWENFAGVVLRSTWDYHLRPDAFDAWLTRLETVGAPVLNPFELLRWNQRKTYLQELAAVGVPVVPTRWLRAGEDVDLSELLTVHGWDRAVIKPVVSASAAGTWEVNARALDHSSNDRFRDQLVHSAVMVQPFVAEITTHGEWSLVFFGGIYSHAVLKNPAQGDFRVQEQFGGLWASRCPPPYLVEGAEHIIRLVAAEHSLPLYARVDCVEVAEGDRFLLMELELIEPALFFSADLVRAPARFVSALANRFNPSRHRL